MRHKPLFVAALLATFAVFGSAAFMLAMRGPTREDFDRVIVGMHRETALSILGTPNEIEPGNNREWLHYRSRDARIVVYVQGEHVVSKLWYPQPRQSELANIWRLNVQDHPAASFLISTSRMREYASVMTAYQR
jgi:hypothetical protein